MELQKREFELKWKMEQKYRRIQGLRELLQVFSKMCSLADEIKETEKLPEEKIDEDHLNELYKISKKLIDEVFKGKNFAFTLDILDDVVEAIEKKDCDDIVDTIEEKIYEEFETPILLDLKFIIVEDKIEKESENEKEESTGE
ncbi:MAG: hypothetical protein ACE5K0_08980 [Candidatus Methanofastidiosia archaeon]